VTVTDNRDAVGLRRHHLIRAADVAGAPAYEPHSRGFAGAPLVSGATGSVHMGLGLCSLEGGRLDLHVHSFEESFYVLEGTPSLHLDGRDVRLRRGACGVVPVGTPHAWWSGDGRALWIDMLAPRPRDGSQPRDTFFLGPAPKPRPEPLDVRDPRNRHLFALAEGDMNLDELKKGSEVTAPTVSASMATAVLAYSGIAVKMLVDKRLGAELSTMFMVDYQPGAIAHPHDHPFEEAYYMLEGEVDVVADGERYTLEAGDVFWTGVGCVHAFYEMRGGFVRWLETSAPQPPDRHSYRFDRDWEYLADTLG
jgi:quercetin dioxygenase-like cupin family protein